jgi:hypothetical protein
MEILVLPSKGGLLGSGLEVWSIVIIVGWCGVWGGVFVGDV